MSAVVKKQTAFLYADDSEILVSGKNKQDIENTFNRRFKLPNSMVDW